MAITKVLCRSFHLDVWEVETEHFICHNIGCIQQHTSSPDPASQSVAGENDKTVIILEWLGSNHTQEVIFRTQKNKWHISRKVNGMW